MVLTADNNAPSSNRLPTAYTMYLFPLPAAVAAAAAAAVPAADREGRAVPLEPGTFESGLGLALGLAMSGRPASPVCRGLGQVWSC